MIVDKYIKHYFKELYLKTSIPNPTFTHYLHTYTLFAALNHNKSPVYPQIHNKMAKPHGKPQDMATRDTQNWLNLMSLFSGYLLIQRWFTRYFWPTWTSSFLSSSIRTAIGYRESSPVGSLAAIVGPSPVTAAIVVSASYFAQSRTHLLKHHLHGLISAGEDHQSYLRSTYNVRSNAKRCQKSVNCTEFLQGEVWWLLTARLGGATRLIGGGNWREKQEMARARAMFKF